MSISQADGIHRASGGAIAAAGAARGVLQHRALFPVPGLEGDQTQRARRDAAAAAGATRRVDVGVLRGHGVRSRDGRVDGSALPTYLAQHEQVQPFHLVTRPGRLAQELQAGRHAGLLRETAHRNALAQADPAVVGAQGGHHGFQRDAVQGVAGLRRAGRDLVGGG